MPDALPPVGVLLADLDAATLPLEGTELTFVMQGGQPKRTTVSSIGGGGGYVLPGTYSHSGTYTPTVTTGSGATVAPYLLSGYSRVGNGAGVPLAGDTVSVFGTFEASGLVDGCTISVSLPFEAGASAFAWCNARFLDGVGLSVAAVGLVDPMGFDVTIGVTADTSGTVSFEITYQTANAVDP